MTDGRRADSKRLHTPAADVVVDVESLLQGRSEIRLVYRGVEYRLRVTRQGKLLLTK